MEKHFFEYDDYKFYIESNIKPYKRLGISGIEIRIRNLGIDISNFIL